MNAKCYRVGFVGGGGMTLASSQAYPRRISCMPRLVAIRSLHLSSTSLGLRTELYEAKPHPTYGSEAEFHLSINGAE